MVTLYNKLQKTTLPVEKPLVATKLEAVGKSLAHTALVDPYPERSARRPETCGNITCWTLSPDAIAVCYVCVLQRLHCNRGLRSLSGAVMA